MLAKGIAHFGLVCSLSLTTGFSHAMMVSDLLISEIMVNPAALSDARGEWFELYNPTTRGLNLSDVTLDDFGGDCPKIDSELLILPTDYLRLSLNVDPDLKPVCLFDSFTPGDGGTQ